MKTPGQPSEIGAPRCLPIAASHLRPPERLNRLHPMPHFGGYAGGGAGQRRLAQILSLYLGGHASGNGMAGVRLAHQVGSGLLAFPNRSPALAWHGPRSTSAQAEKNALSYA